MKFSLSLVQTFYSDLKAKEAPSRFTVAANCGSSKEGDKFKKVTRIIWNYTHLKENYKGYNFYSLHFLQKTIISNGIIDFINTQPYGPN